jgi:hypothetical protein
MSGEKVRNITDFPSPPCARLCGETQKRRESFT